LQLKYIVFFQPSSFIGKYAEAGDKFTTVPYLFNANPDNHNANPNGNRKR